MTLQTWVASSAESDGDDDMEQGTHKAHLGSFQETAIWALAPGKPASRRAPQLASERFLGWSCCYG
jgi:hypothetical protein